ncbi:MAG: hypothetical protein E7090_03570 [Bacteroidales bacterium]|nr:hypothetical protein [Bacteroidales bacterium]
MQQATQPQENNEKEDILYSTEGLLSKLKWPVLISSFVFSALWTFISIIIEFYSGYEIISTVDAIYNVILHVSLFYVYLILMNKCVILSTNKLILTSKGIIYKTILKKHYIPWNNISEVKKNSHIFKDNTGYIDIYIIDIDRISYILHIKMKDSNCVDIYLSGFKLDENFLKIINEYLSYNVLTFKKIDKNFIDKSNNNRSWIIILTVLVMGFYPLLIFIAFLTYGI